MYVCVLVQSCGEDQRFSKKWKEGVLLREPSVMHTVYDASFPVFRWCCDACKFKRTAHTHSYIHPPALYKFKLNDQGKFYARLFELIQTQLKSLIYLSIYCTW